MFRYKGDTNAADSSQRSGNPVSREPEASSCPPLALSEANRAAARAEQCLHDDRFYNMLYKNYDTRCLDTGAPRCQVEATDESHLDAASPCTCKQLESAIAPAGKYSSWISASSASARSQVFCAYSAARDRPPDASAPGQAEAHAGRDFKLVGTGIPTTSGLPSPAARVTPPYMDFPLARNGLPRHQRFPHSLGEVSYGLPSVPALFDSWLGQSHVNAPSPLPEEPQHTDALPPSEPYKCPVCLKCVRQRKPASTICGHVFCSSCIRTALRTTCKCPVCQRLMTTRQIFRIFI